LARVFLPVNYEEDIMATYSEGRSSTDVATDETDRLIASNKVEGAAVYNRQGERLGSVYNFMVDKYTGKVAYAVMSFGGFLGIGDSYHPLPWKSLTYDRSIGGYVVELDRSKLEGAPSYRPDEDPWTDRDYGRRVYDYYGVEYPYY
jgi:sporulation protein YlmC with PRC-barrel domain